MSVEHEAAKTLYLELEEPVETKKLKEVLEQVGIRTKECRTVTPSHIGYMITDVMIDGIWNQETGAAYCQGRCPEGQKHVPWQKLTTEQQESFYRSYVMFLEASRVEQLIPDQLLEDDELFEKVTLSRDH